MAYLAFVLVTSCEVETLCLHETFVMIKDCCAKYGKRIESTGGWGRRV